MLRPYSSKSKPQELQEDKKSSSVLISSSLHLDMKISTDKANWKFVWRGDSRQPDGSGGIFELGFEVREQLKKNSVLMCFPFSSIQSNVIAFSSNREICPIFPFLGESGKQKFTWIYGMIVDINDKHFWPFHRSSLSGIDLNDACVMHMMEYLKEDVYVHSIPPSQIVMAIPIERFASDKIDQLTSDDKPLSYFYTAYQILDKPIINKKAVCFSEAKPSLMSTRANQLIKEIEEKKGKKIEIDRPEAYPLVKKYQLMHQHAFFISNRFELDISCVESQHFLQYLESKNPRKHKEMATRTTFNFPNLHFFESQLQNPHGVLFSSQANLEKHNEKFFTTIMTQSTLDARIKNERSELKAIVKKSLNKTGIKENLENIDYFNRNSRRIKKKIR